MSPFGQTMNIPAPDKRGAFADPPAEGRGGKILALGIISLLLLGPILGLPAWIMGHRDLKRIRRGEIRESDRSSTQVGMVFGIVGTFVSPVFLITSLIAATLFFAVLESYGVQRNKDAMMKDAGKIAAVVKEFRLRPSGAAGGGGSYEGFVLSEEMKHTANGTYMVHILAADRVQVVGSSTRNNSDGLIASIDESGSIVHWEFSGAFDPLRFYRQRRGKPEQEGPRDDGNRKL